MAGKTWEPGKKGARDLNRHIRKGSVVYTVRSVSHRVAPYEDGQLYAAHVFDWRSPITGNWMTGHLSAAGLLAQEGRVYETPPRGIRNIADPGPQVGAPLGNDYDSVLDELELRGLEKHVGQTMSPRQRRALNARRP